MDLTEGKSYIVSGGIQGTCKIKVLEVTNTSVLYEPETSHRSIRLTKLMLSNYLGQILEVLPDKPNDFNSIEDLTMISGKLIGKRTSNNHIYEICINSKGVNHGGHNLDLRKGDKVFTSSRHFNTFKIGNTNYYSIYPSDIVAYQKFNR